MTEKCLCLTRPQSDVHHCKWCGWPIFWTLTRKGRRMPVDVEGLDIGNVLLHRRSGISGMIEAEVIRYPPSAENKLKCRHEAHVVTCPVRGTRKAKTGGVRS